ncbi:diacylglycerol kinase [Paraburkholderia sp. Tr-20389]|uniref:diacylglycerol kinase n=1 Tax=Paraburkholderia sp. Tr-20389 TaxID=2703903 RepID=UPI00197F94AF|nr:diacylglycerol kinase [Paraburkholderia sp. Tr-20389]MBN3757969.1 diacylglycerol kinase [Paraburkholderia sp. Tr-20389]
MQTRQSNALRASPQESLRDAKTAASQTEHYGEPFDDVHEMHEDGAPRSRYAGQSRSVPASPSAMSSTTRARTSHESAPDGEGVPSQAEVQEPHEPLGPDDPLAPLPFNPYKGNRGITRAWHAMKNSFAGFRVAIREESAFRQELTLAAILVPCGIFVPVDAVSRVLLLGSVFLVLIVELLNSSVEAAIDRISLERHELSRRAKDLGSAAVMVALFICVMTWGLLVGPLVAHWIAAALH